jgi:Ca2+-binding RTX toxin-like protein
MGLNRPAKRRLASTAVAAVLSALCISATASAATFTNSAPIIVPNLQGDPSPLYPSQIAVSGISGQTISVRVSLNDVSAQTPAEIDALVVAPNGQSVVLMSDVCGTSDVVGLTLVFDDTAANAIGDSCVSATYRPFDGAATTANFSPPIPGPYGATLAALGSGPNGTWRLFVRNNGSYDGNGTIAAGWTLEIVDAIEPELPPPILTPRFCNGKTATIVGTDGSDRLVGTPGDDVILGLGGGDSIIGRAGNDRICGSGEADKLFGNDGRDRVFGGTGNDRLTGGNGKDTLDGESGTADRCRNGGSGARGGPTQGLQDVFISCER